MSFSRSYDAAQTLAVLGALEGSVVVRITPQRNPLGAGVGTVCIVGELTNDQGSVAAKTAVNTLREITSAEQLTTDYGRVSTQIGTSANGYEGNTNMALALPGIAFPRLLVIAPDLAAGSVTFTRSSGGDALTIPAGFRVGDGSGMVYLTLEDATFASSGSSQTASVRVRAQTEATSDASINDIDTLVDSALLPTGHGVTSVANAAALSNPDSWDTQYSAAIAATLGDSGLAGQIDVIVCRRHTAAMRTALITNATSAAAGKRARTAVYSPPIGTSNTTAVGSSGVGVATSGARYLRLRYEYPSIQSIIPSRGSSDPVAIHSDLFRAHMLSITHPTQNEGQHRDKAPYVLDLESGIGVSASQAQYQTWRGLGIGSPQIVDGYAELLSDRTTDLTAPNDSGTYVRTRDWLATSLHEVAAPWAKKPATERNKQLLLGELAAMLESFKGTSGASEQLIANYSIDGVSGNNSTTAAQGIFVIKVAVQTLASMNTIVFVLEAGAGVSVSQIAA